MKCRPSDQSGFYLLNKVINSDDYEPEGHLSYNDNSKVAFYHASYDGVTNQNELNQCVLLGVRP